MPHHKTDCISCTVSLFPKIALAHRMRAQRILKRSTSYMGLIYFDSFEIRFGKKVTLDECCAV